MTAWDLLRCFLAVSAFVARWAHWLLVPIPVNHLDGTEFFEEPDRVGARVRLPVVFEVGLRRYSSIIALMSGPGKKTGDEAFDRDTYVRATEPAFVEALRDHAAVRATLRKLFDSGTRVVSGDGNILWVEGKKERTTDDLNLLFELRGLLDALEVAGSRRRPHFEARIAAVESLWWALSGYGFGAFLEYFVTSGALHVSGEAVVTLGLMAAPALAAFLFVLMFVLLKRSPKGRNIWVSGHALVFILFGLLWGGTQLVSDLNRHLDSSRAVVITRTILRREAHQRRYGTSHWLYVTPDDKQTPVQIGSSIQVSEHVYRRSFQAPGIELHVAKGWLGLAWYRNILVGKRAP